MAALRLVTHNAVLLTVGALSASACGAIAPSGSIDAGVWVDASLSATDAADAASDIDAPETGACVSPADCIDFPTGPAVACCIKTTCIYGQAAIDAVPCTDADVQLITASIYINGCATDSDCIAVSVGNFCIIGAGNCPSVAINKVAYPQYQADVTKTNAAICRAVTGCGAQSGPCCRHYSCQIGTECSDSVSPPGGDAGADTEDGSPE